MVLDSSAVLAIFLNEPEREAFLKIIFDSRKKLFSVASALETAIVLEARKGEIASRELDLFLHDSGIELVSVDVEQLEIARLAFSKYGKGRNPAGLNFGDCFAYALSKVSGEKLLAKGQDFNKTDLELIGLGGSDRK
jgi:ribonuclease VapC